MRFGRPRYCESENTYFNSTEEYDQYAKENNLIPIEGRAKQRSNCRIYRYDENLKKVVEVTEGRK